MHDMQRIEGRLARPQQALRSTQRMVSPPHRRAECFVEPGEVYRRARQRGMDFVTISDHNCIRGALEIADLPGTFISAEVTTYFPENGSKVHLLVWGIDEPQFRMIQELRANIYQLQQYLRKRPSCAPYRTRCFRVNGRLTIDQHRTHSTLGAIDGAPTYDDFRTRIVSVLQTENATASVSAAPAKHK